MISLRRRFTFSRRRAVSEIVEQINGNAGSVRQLLANHKFGLGIYQREYGWQESQVRELINDLTARFAINTTNTTIGRLLPATDHTSSAQSSPPPRRGADMLLTASSASQLFHGSSRAPQTGAWTRYCWRHRSRTPRLLHLIWRQVLQSRCR